MSDIQNQDLLDFFRENSERPWHVQDVQKNLKIDDRAALQRALAQLADKGELIRTRRRTYGLPKDMNLFLGKLQVTAGGYGFVIPEDRETKDLFIPADRLGGAWDGDKVVARPNPMKSDDGRQSGEIVRIIERKNRRVVGTLEYSKGYAILRPDSPRLRERILLTPESVGKIDGGMRIVVRMVWPEDSGEKDAFGEVEDVLGEQDDPEVETLAVIVKHGLKDTFDPDTMAEAEAVPSTVTGEMMAGRTDYRGVPTFTIDGEDAKDFDDALSLERLDKGKGNDRVLRIGVHIADVSYYVAEGTSLDSEAVERATSVYLPGRVLPMLPEELSNGICSLVEGEPRLALSAFVDITRGGEVKGVKFKETVIQSDARLTYENVQEFADGGRLPQGLRKLERDIKVLMNLAERLRADRMGAGSLDFNFTEAKVDVDEQGALHLRPIRSNQARQLIEEMMLLANRLVAEELDKRDIPALYRVHEDPSEAKIDALNKALQKLGYKVDLKEATPQDLQEVLKQAAGKPESQMVNTLLLRSLKQARYSSENLGHFGLAFPNYLHFTSPIRRYPDLVVHRVLRAMLQHRLSPTLKERMKSDFPKLAEHASTQERVAQDAERDLSRYFHAVWAKENRGETFPGTVSGVTNFGVFVTLPNGIEGLMHVSHLDDDYYVFVEDSLMLMGKSSRKKYRMGDRVEVRILNANPTIRQIDLIPASMSVPEVEPDDTIKKQRAPKKLKTPIGTPVPPIAAKSKSKPKPKESDAAAAPAAAAAAAGTGDDGARASGSGRSSKRTGANDAGAGKASSRRAPSGRRDRRPSRDAPAKAAEPAPETAPKPTRQRRRRLVFADPYARR